MPSGAELLFGKDVGLAVSCIGFFQVQPHQADSCSSKWIEAMVAEEVGVGFE
jgi:hypothetical protein